jgi:hypothetical protein
MFNRLFALSIAVMLILFAGMGYFLYQEHTEEIIPSWTNPEINETPQVARLNSELARKPLASPSPTKPPPTDRWEYKPEIQQPTVTEDLVLLPMDQIEFRDVTTPDGKVHLAPFRKGSPPIEGGYISYPEDNEKLSAPSQVVLENFQYPKGVNRLDYRIKMVLAARDKISMEEVEARLKQGTLAYTIHSSNEDWVDSIGGEAELKDFLIKAGVSDTAIDQTLNSLNAAEKSTSSAAEVTEAQDVSVSNDETSVESHRSLKDNGVEVPTSVQKESNVTERYETEKQLIERYGREEGRKRLRERGSHIADEPEFKPPDIPSANPNKDQ